MPHRMDMVAIDLCCLAGSFALSYWAKFGDLGFVDSAAWKALLAVLLLCDLVLMLASDPWARSVRRRWWEDLAVHARIALAAFLAACVGFYLLKIGEYFSREMLVETFAGYLASSFLLCRLRVWALRRDRGAGALRRVVAVAASGQGVESARVAFGEDADELELAGVCLVDGEPSQPLSVPTAPASKVRQLCADVRADELLLLVPAACLPHDAIASLMEDGIRVRVAVESALGVQAESATMSRVGAYRTVDLEQYSFGAAQRLYLPAKRAIDIAIGLVGCLVTLPVMLAVKLAYAACGDRHPIVYKQMRVGLRGREFCLWKLRSMVWDADERLQELLQDPELREEWERDQKLAHDPRVTSVGKILRASSLDEFPQFLNLLTGDMSLVGPRPLVPGELESHGGTQLYNRVRPGITGWWACNGRSDIDYRERLELEYHYVRHCSPWLDVVCVARTVGAVLRGSGAR